MPSIVQVPDLAAGDVIQESWVDDVMNDVNFLVVAGADIASGTTTTVTSAFHKVTGTTTIDNLSHAAPVKGQEARLWFAGALTVRNNGGGTGNIRTLAGTDRSVSANEIVTFTYDGTLWRESSGAPKKPLTALGAFSGKNNAALADVAMTSIVWDDGFSWGTSNTFITIPASGRYKVSCYISVAGQSGSGSAQAAIVHADAASATIVTIGQAIVWAINTPFTVEGADTFSANERILIKTQNGATGSAGSVGGRVLVEQILS